MNYEKKYKDALEKARGWYNNPNSSSIGKSYLYAIFPELKESGDEDEKIRKEICIYLDWLDGHKDWQPKGNYTIRDMIAWLEKQGDKRLINFDEAEKEKNDFISGQFIECRKSFNEFKENNSYWLEYLGDDDYIGRSDNILNQKFHITPRQLFTLFTQQHCPKEDNTNEETNAPTGYGKYIDECLNEATKHFFSEGEDTYSVADLFYAGVRCGKSLFEKQGEQKVDYTTLVETGNGGINALVTRELPTNGCGEQKSAWSEEDEVKINRIVACLENLKVADNDILLKDVDWLKSLKDRVQPKQKWSGEDERMCQETIDWFEKKCFPYALEHENPARESIKWLKSLKQRIGG